MSLALRRFRAGFEEFTKALAAACAKPSPAEAAPGRFYVGIGLDLASGIWGVLLTWVGTTTAGVCFRKCWF